MAPKRLIAVGTFTVDIIVSGLPRIASPGEVVYLEHPVELRLGGHAVNVGIDSVKLGFPGEVYSVGAVGRDVFGELLVRCLKAEGVKAEVELVGEGTARNVIIALRGEDRRFHVYLGANSRLSSSHVMESLKSLKPRYLYLALGYSPSLDSKAIEVIEEAKRTSDFILVDPAYTNEASVKALTPVMNLVDAIHLNTLELKMLTGSQSISEALSRLAGLDTLVVVTGDSGVVALYKGKILRQPSFKVKVAEPTGAGDAFCAGLLKAVASRGSIGDHRDLSEILMYAQAAGATAVTSIGATEGVTRERVEALIDSMGTQVLESTVVEEL